MTRIGFLFAKLSGNEDALQAMSTPVLGEFKDKSVALIGNARSLSQTDYGSEIDGHDIIIRINGAPMPAARSHGTRTDMIAMSMPTPSETLVSQDPARLMWMTRKRKRLPYWLARDARFFLNRKEDVARLRDVLGGPPTTGAMVIDLLMRSEAAKIELYGFDFFASLSLSGSRSADQVAHDFNAESAWVDDLLNTDPRLSLHRA